MAKRDELNSRNSPLEFKLHRLKFIDLLRNGRCKEALNYAKNFSRFREHLKGMFVMYVILNIWIAFSYQNNLFSSTEKQHLGICYTPMVFCTLPQIHLCKQCLASCNAKFIFSFCCLTNFSNAMYWF